MFSCFNAIMIVERKAWWSSINVTTKFVLWIDTAPTLLGFCAGASACVRQFSACVEMISLNVRRTGELQAQILMHLVCNHSNAIPKQLRCMRRKNIPAQKSRFALISDFSLSWTSDVERSSLKKFSLLRFQKQFFGHKKFVVLLIGGWRETPKANVQKKRDRTFLMKTVHDTTKWCNLSRRSFPFAIKTEMKNAGKKRLFHVGFIRPHMIDSTQP